MNYDPAEFGENGYLVVPGLVGGERLAAMQSAADNALADPQQPWELETQLGYPGAPKSHDMAGGDTIRRLLNAYDRNPLWAQWALDEEVRFRLAILFSTDTPLLSLAHHNCLMTKAPRHSSDTGWHQDIRYWSFTRPELISVWLALGEETADNGGLIVIPGSHKVQFSDEQFDQSRFFHADLPQNQRLIEQAKALHLKPGDVLFFDCKLLHRASRNHQDKTKFSLVFTYRCKDNPPLPSSRSASREDIPVKKI